MCARTRLCGSHGKPGAPGHAEAGTPAGFHSGHAGTGPTRGGIRLVCLLAILGIPGVVRGDVAVRLRHDLTAGVLTAYDVRIEGERTAGSRPGNEVVRFTQSGALTLVILETPDQRTARRAWMMTLESPEVSSLTRDGQPVIDPPSAKELGLPPQASQLRVSTIDSSGADASPVGGSRVQQAAMLLALDFAHWPDRLVGAGESWKTQSSREELAGTWTQTYTALEGRGGERLARGTFDFAGELAGPFVNVARIESVRGEWFWRLAKRGLERSRSEVLLAYGPPDAPRRLHTVVTLTLKERRRLDDARLDAARADLRALADLASASDTADERRVALEAYLRDRPESLWLPIARGLLDRAVRDEAIYSDMDAERVGDALVALITRWQNAALADKLEALTPIRATFAQLMSTNRAVVHELAGGEDVNLRAMAIFCVAFGDEAADLAKVIAACGDGDARVRMWAAYGLAERRDAATDPDVLFRLLDDPEEKVRRRACMAVQTCVTRQSAQRDRFVKRLLEMLANDPEDEVHPDAAQALDAIATRADLPALIAAESTQEVPAARWQLEDTIQRLGGKTKGPSDPP